MDHENEERKMEVYGMGGRIRMGGLMDWQNSQREGISMEEINVII